MRRWKTGLRWGFFVGGLFLVTGCATVQHAPSARRSLNDICQQNNITWQWDNLSQVVTLRRGGVSAKTLVGSAVVVIGQERVVLSEPLRRQKGMIIVPPDFQGKVVDQLGQKAPVVSGRRYRILLDPGHGGRDPGAISRNGTQEKGVVLDIAQRLKTRLEEAGYDVRMTRNSDQFVSLEERTEIASKFEGDLFVSIHANSNPSRNISGVEVYSLRDMTSQEIREEQRLRNHRILYNNLAMDKENPDLARILADLLYSAKRSESGVLAAYIAKGLSANLRAVDRGARQAGYFVLRNTLVPAVLVEVGFLTNGNEEKLLKTSAYRDKIADGIGLSLVRYLNR